MRRIKREKIKCDVLLRFNEMGDFVYYEQKVGKTPKELIGMSKKS